MSHKKRNAFLPLVFSSVLIFSACKDTENEAEKTFTVKWQNHDGTVLEVDENITKGTVPTFDGKAPEKASDAQFTYTFTGWSPEVGAVDSDTTYTAQFTSTTNTYTVTWKNFDDTVLETDTNVAYGTTPTYDGAAPTKEGNAENGYVFSGWEPSVKAVDGNATYKATFSAQKNTYIITWKNADGTVLKTDNVEYGATPAYQGAAPTKQGDAEHSYAFDGWEPAVVAVTGNATYTAKYTSTVNKYTVTWKNADGTVLETDANVAYGTLPTYDSATPTKEGDDQYSYAFKGWDKEVVAVTGDVTYTATYDQTVNKYVVVWKNANGVILEVDNNVPYGTTPTYDGSTPVKDADVNSPKYRFIGWDKEVVAVTGNVTYEAKFAAYADLAMIDDFESYEDTVDLLGGGWDQMIYNSTTNTWSNSGTGAVVSYGTRSEDGEGALRFDSYANNVTYGFGKDIDATFLADKSVNALMFKMMMPSITTVKVKITLEEMDLPDGNGGTQKLAPYFTKTLPALVSGEYVSYVIPMNDSGWLFWGDASKGSLVNGCQVMGIDVDDAAKLVRRIEFYTLANDGGNNWPYVGFLDYVAFATSNVTSYTATPSLYISHSYTGKTTQDNIVKFEIQSATNAKATVIDLESPLDVCGTYTLNGLDLTFTSADNGASLVYNGRLVNGGKSIKCTGCTGSLATIVGEMDLIGVQTVDNFETYTEDGVAYYTNSPKESRKGCRGAYYSEYYANSGSSPWGADKWSLMGGSGDQLKLKSDNLGHNGSKNYLCLKNSQDKAMRYMTYGLFDGTSEQNSFRGEKLSFWARSNGKVPSITVRAYSTNSPTPATIDNRCKKVTFTETAAISEWKHYEVALDSRLVYYGLMISLDKNNTGADTFLYVDDIEVYGADPYATYVAPEAPHLDAGSRYHAKSQGFVNTIITVIGDSIAKISVPLNGTTNNANGTYTINEDDNEVRFEFEGGTVYVGTLSEDKNTITYKTVGSGGFGLYLENCDFTREAIADNFESYESSGTMYYQNSGEANRSGARGAYFCDYYSGGSGSPVGGSGWSLMGGSGDQLSLDTTVGYASAQSIKIKGSTAGNMRYLQWDLYKGTGTAIKGVDKFGLFARNANSFNVTIKIVVYKVAQVTPSNQGSNRAELEVTIPANSGWNEYVVNLDANTNYYGYGVIVNKPSSTGYINIDNARYYKGYENPDSLIFAANGLRLAGAINVGPATLNIGENGTAAFTCENASMDSVACTYSFVIKADKQIMVIKMANGAVIEGEFTFNVSTSTFKFEVTSVPESLQAAVSVGNTLTFCIIPDNH